MISNPTFPSLSFSLFLLLNSFHSSYEHPSRPVANLFFANLRASFMYSFIIPLLSSILWGWGTFGSLVFLIIVLWSFSLVPWCHLWEFSCLVVTHSNLLPVLPSCLILLCTCVVQC